MGLQVRLRHALGTRVLELPGRAVDQPVVIGRAGDADVQVPSINVGARHLVLFAHEGRWVVQDGPDSTGTSVNGMPLEGPQVLKARDVLKLGPETNAPTLEIAPAAEVAPTVGAPPAVAPAAVHATQAPPNTRASFAPNAPAAVSSRPRPMPAPVQAPPPPPVPAEPAGAHSESDGDGIGWEPERTAQPAYYVPPRRRSSNLAVALAIIVATGIVAGSAVFVYTHKGAQPKVVTVVLPPPAAPKTDPPRRAPATNIFTEEPAPRAVRPPPPPPDLTDDAEGSPRPAQPPTRPAARTATSDGTGATAARVVSSAVPIASNGRNPNAPRVPESEAFEGASDEPAESPEAARAWKRVESAYYHPDPAKALMAFDIYADDYPDSRKRQLAQYREDVLDKLWWNRVEDLFNKRKDAAAAVAKTEQEIKDSGDDGQAFVKSVLEPRLEEQKARLSAVAKRLETELGYTEAKAPPIGKETEMAALRAKRNAAIYEPWKKKVLKHIRDTHGQYPWANER